MHRVIFIIFTFIICKLTCAQEINLIIQVNDKIEQSSFTNIYITFDSAYSSTKYQVDYVPGNLKLPASAIQRLQIDSSTSIYLYLTYNYRNKNQQSAVFYTKLTQQQLRKPYLIWSIYDFRDKKYRRWYQKDKQQEFASDLFYPNSGILIRKA